MVLLILGCVASAPTATGELDADADVTIATAAGETLAFDPSTTSVRATGRIALTFQNHSSLSHNLVFTDGLTAATRTIVEPGSSDRLLLVSPLPGTYPFVCTIHEGMAGTLVIGD